MPISKERKHHLWLLALFAAILLVCYQLYHILSKPKPRVVHPVSVVVAKVTQQDIPVTLSNLGTVTPVTAVTIRTQVNGLLLRLPFKEGQIVKKGQLIAEIDPRPFQALLVQYQGQLLRDKGLLENARIDLARYKRLWEQDSISQQTYETQKWLVQQYEGNVINDEGLIQSTQLNLYYCRILAPVDGKIGISSVNPGNFVQTTDTNGIVILNQLQPMTVIFSFPEDNIPVIQKRMQGTEPLQVQVRDRTEQRLISTGNLLTLDNQVDTTTGTVRLRAVFDNQDTRLFPNQFVNVTLVLDTLKQATVVPTAAIQYSPKGPFVYRITENNTVSSQAITIGIALDDHTSITKGLTPGDLVVVEGADQLREGAKVTLSGKTA